MDSDTEDENILKRLLHSYEAYYDINTASPALPFAAEAAFHSKSEQYFLTKAAKLSEMESAEYVFFALSSYLSLADLVRLDEAAWNCGISRVKPSTRHRNTDIALVVVATKIADDAFAKAKKLSHYKSYWWGFEGWSNYRVILLETSTKRLVHNRLGGDLKKVFGNI